MRALNLAAAITVHLIVAFGFIGFASFAGDGPGDFGAFLAAERQTQCHDRRLLFDEPAEGLTLFRLLLLSADAAPRQKQIEAKVGIEAVETAFGLGRFQ